MGLAKLREEPSKTGIKHKKTGIKVGSLLEIHQGRAPTEAAFFLLCGSEKLFGFLVKLRTSLL